MRIAFDPVKNELNVRRRGLSFEEVADFDFETAALIVDERRATSDVRMARGVTSRLVICMRVCTCSASRKLKIASGSSAFAKRISARSAAMPKYKPLVDTLGEVRELGAADLEKFRASRDVLPASLLGKVGVRGPQKAPTKERITIRLSAEVVERFRATGTGWQTRVDAALQDWLTRHEPG